MLQLTLVLAVLGPSQFGKSSFINLLSGFYSLQVGTGDGISTTLEVQEVKAPDRFNLFPEGAEVRFLDVPGYGDSDIRLMDEQISESIKYRLVGMDSRKLDVLFVFQSIAESTMSLRSTFVHAEEMFGPSILQSIIVVLTKGDLVAPAMLEKRIRIVDNICRPKHIPYITWADNSTDSIIDEEQLKKQLADLKAALTLLKSYEMTEMQAYEGKVEQSAREMRLNDPSNIIRQEVNVTYAEIITYNETETYEFLVIKPKFTEAEVQQEAKRLQSLQENQELVSVSKEITETVVEYETYTVTESTVRWAFFIIIPYRKTEYYQVQKVRPVNKQSTKTVQILEYREQPLEHFAESLRKEEVCTTELRERLVEKTKVVTKVKTEISETYKRDWTHYKSQAAEILARGQWKQV